MNLLNVINFIYITVIAAVLVVVADNVTSSFIQLMRTSDQIAKINQTIQTIEKEKCK